MEEALDIPADSLVGPDSAAGFPPDSLAGVDSLALLPPPVAPVTAEEVFGSGSTLGTGTLAVPYEAPVYASALFQGVVLALALAYLIVLYHHIREAWALCKKPSFDASKSNRMTEMQGGTYTRLLWSLVGIGLPMLSLVAWRVADNRLPAFAAADGGIGVLVLVALAAIALFQVGLLKLIGGVSLSQEMTSQLIALKFNCFALGTLVLSPPAFLFLLTPPDRGHVLLYLLSGGVVALVLLFLAETLALFLRKKTPILHWFLYLCTVEIFPFSFFYLGAGRIW